MHHYKLTREEIRKPGDKYKGDFGTVTAVMFCGNLIHRVDYNDGTWQFFDDEEDAIEAVTDYSGMYREL
jgi:hypothetical protein